MGFAFPAWLEAKFITDNTFGEAYDTLTSEERAYIKTAIARTAVVYGCSDVPTARGVKSMRQGFSLYERVRPASWVLIFWDAQYSGPTRILAALLPAILAGAPHILTCRVHTGVDQVGVQPSVLAALELAGQELAADLTPEEAIRLIAECSAARERGRVVILGNSEYLVPLGKEAIRCGTPLRRLAHAVRIGVDVSSLPAMYATLPYGMLSFAHSDADIVPFEGEGPAGLSVVFCGEDAVEQCMGKAPLVLTPGNEACWVWPDLGMGFFREKGLAFSDFCSANEE